MTLVVEVMCQDVHGESWHAHIHLPTDATFLGCVRVQAQVSLLVPVKWNIMNKRKSGQMTLIISPGQVAACGIVLSTLGTFVFWFINIVEICWIFASPITCKEWLIGVSCGLAIIEFVDTAWVWWRWCWGRSGPGRDVGCIIFSIIIDRFLFNMGLMLELLGIGRWREEGKLVQWSRRKKETWKMWKNTVVEMMLKKMV